MPITMYSETLVATGVSIMEPPLPIPEPGIFLSIQRWEPHLLTGRQMVQGIITKRQDRPQSTTVLPVQVPPRTTSIAIRVLKALATISERTNTPTNRSGSRAPEGSWSRWPDPIFVERLNHPGSDVLYGGPTVFRARKFNLPAPSLQCSQWIGCRAGHDECAPDCR